MANFTRKAVVMFGVATALTIGAAAPVLPPRVHRPGKGVPVCAGAGCGSST